jgi:hypothetical protein
MMLSHAHSGFRYLVLFLLAAAIIDAAYRVASGKPFAKPGRILQKALVGIADLQLLLGLGLLFQGFRHRLAYEHMGAMILAITALHTASVMGRKNESAAAKIWLGGCLIAAALVIGGILRLGRPIF